jgi:nicotinate-nucleotide adenylyltransferase
MKVGLYFGTFNPVHSGHMIIAQYMAEFTDLEQVWLVVSPQNPLKPAGSLLNDFQRLEMVRIAIGDYKKLKLSKTEFELPRPSYTIHTLDYLREKHPEHQFALIMGADNIETLDKWKNYEQILAGYEIYVYPRPNCTANKFAGNPNIKLTEAPMMEISSTFIRNAIKQKKDVRYMMPQDVFNYLDEMGFYKK